LHRRKAGREYLGLAIEQGRADAREVLRAPAQIAWRTSELA